jgi:hypothetical protein
MFRYIGGTWRKGRELGDPNGGRGVLVILMENTIHLVGVLSIMDCIQDGILLL